ncbi:MAG: hypothetical protein IH606_13210 [Burkholderiales bacterium]|nr:hypothetical protein [Burkholderiales bacterium]
MSRHNCDFSAVGAVGAINATANQSSALALRQTPGFVAGRLALVQLRQLLRHSAFIYFHPANRGGVFAGVSGHIVLAAASMHSFHEFHIRYQANSKTCGRRDIGPGATQRLTHGHPPDQAYATKHGDTSLYCFG